MGYRDYSTAKGRIVDGTGHGDFTTIGAALTALGSGAFFIRPGTYTEDITLPANTHLTAFPGDEILPSVMIVGKISFSDTGTSVISSISLQTNSDYCLSVTGANASVLYLESVSIIASNNTAINYTCSSSSSQIKMTACEGDIITTGIAMFASSSAGSISFIDTIMTNSGGSTTASTASAGSLNIDTTTLSFPITTSGVNIFFMTNSTIDCAGLNTTALISSTSSTPNYIEHSNLQSGTAATITINTPGSIIMAIDNINCLAGSGNAITGTGTLNAGIITFTGSANTITTSNVNKLTTYGGTIV